MKKAIFIIHLFLILQYCFSQNIADSLSVLSCTKQLISICEKVDFSDPNILKLGVYYKAAELIAYQGNDVKRNLKTTINYTNKDEKAYTDALCKQLTVIIGKNKDWKIDDFSTLQNENGTFFIQKILYRNSIYEHYSSIHLNFQKIENTFLLVSLE